MTGQPVTGGGTEPPPPLLRVLRGSPSDEELAALVAVLAVRAAGPEAVPATVPSRWADRDALVRRTLPPAGPGAWRAVLS